MLRNVLILMPLFILSCSKKPFGVKLNYEDCYYHIHNEWGRAIYQVIDYSRFGTKNIYITRLLNSKFELGVEAYTAMSVSYIDKHMYATRKEICKNAYRKDAFEKCIEEGYELNVRKMKCPNPKEYFDKYDSGKYLSFNIKFRKSNGNKYRTRLDEAKIRVGCTKDLDENKVEQEACRYNNKEPGCGTSLQDIIEAVQRLCK